MMDWRYIEQFQYEGPNQWVRLFPFGAFSRFGRAFEFTRDVFSEMVDNFRNGIPAFKPPIKVTHEDTPGKVGNIIDLDIREDGLYGMVDWFERGVNLLRDKAFQYISPEAHLEETEWEGKKVKNVLMGAALVNNPYFGETALFSIDDREGNTPPESGFPTDSASTPGRTSIVQGEEVLDENTMKSAFIDAFRTVFPAKPDPQPEPEPVEMSVPVEETEEFKALQAEVEKFKAAEAKATAEAEHKGRVEKFAAALGESFAPLADLPEKLAVVAQDHPDEADYIAQQMKAMAAQVDMVKLFGEIGVGGDPDAEGDPATRFTKQAEQMVADGKAKDMSEAYTAMARKDPDGFRAYRRASAKREEE